MVCLEVTLIVTVFASLSTAGSETLEIKGCSGKGARLVCDVV